MLPGADVEDGTVVRWRVFVLVVFGAVEKADDAVAAETAAASVDVVERDRRIVLPADSASRVGLPSSTSTIATPKPSSSSTATDDAHQLPSIAARVVVALSLVHLACEFDVVVLNCAVQNVR